MKKFTKDEIKNVLLPYLAIISRCILKAWDDYIKENNPHRKSKRTKSNIINDEIVENIMEAFEREKTSYMGKRKGLRYLVVKTTLGNVLLRFNKLLTGSKLRASNNNTIQGNLFAQQQNIPGFPLTEINLIAGYTVTGKGLSIECYIVCTDNEKHVLWDFPITSYGQATINTMPSTAPPPTQSTSQPKRVYKKVNTAKNKNKTNQK